MNTVKDEWCYQCFQVERWDLSTVAFSQSPTYVTWQVKWNDRLGFDVQSACISAPRLCDWLTQWPSRKAKWCVVWSRHSNRCVCKFHVQDHWNQRSPLYKCFCKSFCTVNSSPTLCGLYIGRINFDTTKVINSSQTFITSSLFRELNVMTLVPSWEKL